MQICLFRIFATLYHTMPPLSDDYGLQEAIKTTLVQLCKGGVGYQCELTIAGTVGVTVDKKKVILVHFNERLDCPTTSRELAEQDQSGAPSSASLGLLPLGVSTPSQHHSTNYTDLPSFSAASITKSESFSSKGYAFPSTISIDIDSDSESLCELGFEDDVILVDSPSVIRKKEVMWSGEDEREGEAEGKSGVDMKNAVGDIDTGGGGNGQSLDDIDNNSTSGHLIVDKRLFMKQRTSTSSLPNVSLTVTLPRPNARRSSCGEDLSGTSSGTYHQLHQDQQRLKYQCEVCGKNYHTLGLLEAHLVEAHGVVESVEIGKIMHYSCRHCDKMFRYQATLDKHEFLHVAEKPFKCQLCANSYCYQDSLHIHMNVHKGILECSICHKLYSSRRLLQKHIVYMHEMRRVRSGGTPKRRRISMEDHDVDDTEGKNE